MNKLAIRITSALATRKTQLAERLDELRTDEAGVDDIPWKMILMIGGATIAVGILVAIGAYVTQQLGSIPTAPGF